MAIDQGLADEAVQALRWVVRLRLSSAGWSSAEQTMRRLENALAASDADTLRDAVFELDQLSRRVTEKLGQDAENVPASPKQRDRANELVHRLAPDTGDDEVRRENPE
jgi:hypothetical protein